jgi:hypothetical protein
VLHFKQHARSLLQISVCLPKLFVAFVTFCSKLNLEFPMSLPINRRVRPGIFARILLPLFLLPTFCAAHIPASAPAPAETSPSQVKSVITQMRVRMRSVPLDVVVEALTGHKVLPFNPDDPNHAEVLKRLNAAAASVAAKIKAAGGISNKRVNEVGNVIEDYVRAAMTAQGMPARVPTGEKSGKARVTGYPDVAFTFNGENFYLDCKTHSKDTLKSTMRTFYLSPSDDPKITCDAVHFILSFETARDAAKADTYQLVRYKIVSLEKLSLDLKYEFNSDNRRMYSGKNGAEILADAACE